MNLLGTLALVMVLAASVSVLIWHRSPGIAVEPAFEEGPDDTVSAGQAPRGRGPRIHLTGRKEVDSVRLCHPSSAIGPAAVEVPVSGHHLYVQVTSDEPELTVQVTLTAEVLAEHPLGEADVASGTSIPPAEPDFEVLLDRKPPLVRQALDPNGLALHPDVTIPIDVYPGETRTLLLVPLTTAKSLMEWQLNILASTTEGQTSVFTSQFVTGDSGWVEYGPDGRRSVQAPFTNHWPLRH